MTPPLDTQNKLVSKLNNIRLKQQRIKDVLEEESKSLLQKLRQSILQEAISGKLVPQDPNDEPAEEQIRAIIENDSIPIKAKFRTLHLKAAEFLETKKPSVLGKKQGNIL